MRDGTMALLQAVTVSGEEGETPRFVHLSSAGVTRPGRPGLDIEGEPPAVRMT